MIHENLALVLSINLLIVGCLSVDDPKSPPKPALQMQSQLVPSHALVIDAGSTGSRLYVYRIEHYTQESMEIPKVDAIANKKVPATSGDKFSGISDFAKGASQAEIDQYFFPLFQFASETLHNENINSFANIPIFLRATAGMRNLRWEDQERIIDSVNSALKKLAERYGFEPKPQMAQVISGNYEGAYAWVNANAANHTLGLEPEQTVGVIEMGGGSLQVTYIPKAQPSGFPIDLGGKKYSLYSYGYNHLGANEAISRIGNMIPECGLTEPVERPLEYDACKREIDSILDADHYCEPNCGLMGVAQPPLTGKFYALGNVFGGVADGCNVNPLNPTNIDDVGREFCRTVETRPSICSSVPKNYLHRYCFYMALVSSIFSGGSSSAHDTFKGLGFAPDTAYITGTTKINGEDASWTKGFLIMELLDQNP